MTKKLSYNEIDEHPITKREEGFSVKVKAVLHTNGKGLWSRAIANVKVELLEYDKPAGHSLGELRVYFDEKHWPVDKFGLIYTDDLFLKELHGLLKKHNLLQDYDVDYSEQGMQGDDYVSCDVYHKSFK